MTRRYVPTRWDAAYRRLSPAQRDAVNQSANRLFARMTGVTRKLNPKFDQVLVKQWLEARDRVMSESAAQNRSGAFSRNPFRNVPVIGPLSATALDAGREAVNAAMAPWMKVARAEHDKGVKEIPGREHNPDIMKYLETCDHLWSTEKRTTWTLREGEEEVAWCAAFVNWCLDQVGIRGTRDAWALKFAKWGIPLSEPQFGAIVVQRTSSWRHVAFVDEANGQFRILGGNQKGPGLRGPSNQVSFQPLNQKITVAYVWPGSA